MLESVQRPGEVFRPPSAKLRFPTSRSRRLVEPVAGLANEPRQGVACVFPIDEIYRQRRSLRSGVWRDHLAQGLRRYHSRGKPAGELLLQHGRGHVRAARIGLCHEQLLGVLHGLPVCDLQLCDAGVSSEQRGRGALASGSEVYHGTWGDRFVTPTFPTLNRARGAPPWRGAGPAGCRSVNVRVVGRSAVRQQSRDTGGQ